MKKAILPVFLAFLFALPVSPAADAPAPGGGGGLPPVSPVSVKPGVYAENRDGKLFYDGARLRLWGVELNGRQSPGTIRRIRSLGFNSVRLQAPDPDDAAAVENFDALFAEAEKQGLFLTVALPRLIRLDKENLPGRDREDFEKWRDAVFGKDGVGGLHPRLYEFVSGMDDRFMAVKHDKFGRMLSHVNAKTGKPWAESGAVVCFELGGDEGYFKNLLDGRIGLGEYFDRLLQIRWNEYLARTYRSTTRVLSAWNESFDPDEQRLENASILLRPYYRQRDFFPARRATDLVSFVMEQEMRRFKALEEILRKKIGRPALCSFDTQYAPCVPYSYLNSQTDVMSLGCVSRGMVSALRVPPSLKMPDSGAVRGKITVWRDLSAPRPNDFRAEFPFRVLALSSLQDPDVVYFSEWLDTSRRAPVEDDAEYLKIPLDYPTPGGGVNEGRSIAADPAYLAACAAAGRIFLSGVLSDGGSGRCRTVGNYGILGYHLWEGVPGEPDWAGGSALAFAPGERMIDDGAIPADASGNGAFKSGKYVYFEWPDGFMTIDSPRCKVYAGKTHGSYRFEDGVVFGDMGKDGFIVAALMSPDGGSLAEGSGEMLFFRTGNSVNTGSKVEASGLSLGGVDISYQSAAARVKAPGTLPVLTTAPEVKLYFPNTLEGATAEGRDFLLRPVDGGRVERNVFSPGPAEVFFEKIRCASRGEKCETPPGETFREEFDLVDSSGGTSHLIGMPALLRGVSWGDSLNKLRLKLVSTGREPKIRPVVGGMYALRIEDVAAFFGTPADIDFFFRKGAMIRMEVVFKHAPGVEKVLGTLTRRYGKPAASDIPQKPGRPSILSWRVVRGNRQMSVIYWEYKDSAMLFLE